MSLNKHSSMISNTYYQVSAIVKSIFESENSYFIVVGFTQTSYSILIKMFLLTLQFSSSGKFFIRNVWEVIIHSVRFDLEKFKTPLR